MNQLAFLRLCLGAVLFVACSTSGDKDKDKEKTSMAGSSAGAAAPAAGSGGSTGTGTRSEGMGCKNDGDCASGLGCVISPIDTMIGFRVCARRCSDDDSCMSGERCQTYTGKPSDAHCWNFVDEAFKACGPMATAMCGDNLECIYAESGPGQIPEGLCVSFCQLPGGMASPGLLTQCPSGQACLSVGDKDAGLCAKEVARGEVCGLDRGTLCGDKDICITDISGMTRGESRCYQDCTADKMCEGGKTCMQIDTDAWFCE